jgi:mannose-6-phosphate isomerase-like protein (cupin superfamily)
MSKTPTKKATPAKKPGAAKKTPAPKKPAAQKPASKKAAKAKAIIKDIGPKRQAFMLEDATKQNTTYRTVAWTGRYLQLTLMSIPVGGDIGLEVHHDTDQFLRLDAGKGRAQMGPAKSRLTFDQEVEDGWCVLVPAGTWHNVTNIGDEPMQLYVIYAPSHHAQGNVHLTKEDSEKDEEAGTDEPPKWTVQPPKSK